MGQRDIFDHEREGWRFHDFATPYTCGHCGRDVSAALGLECQLAGRTFKADKTCSVVDVRLCTNCLNATTFYRGGVGFQAGDAWFQEQIPAPLLGQAFDASKLDGNDSAIKLIVELYDEARRAMGVNAPSCAVLMFRKLLMHIAVEKGAKTREGFSYYCDHLRTKNFVAVPQYPILTRIQKAGNAENHQIRRTTEKDARDLLNLMAHLIEGIYFID